MEKLSKIPTRGISLDLAFFFLLLFLKLAKIGAVATWSWVWIFAPLLIPLWFAAKAIVETVAPGDPKLQMQKLTQPTLRIALEAMALDPTIEKIQITDFENSHITYAAGRFTWHVLNEFTTEFVEVNYRTATACALDVSAEVSGDAHFSFVSFE